MIMVMLALAYLLTRATALHVRGTASAVGATRSVVTLTDDTAMGINVGSGVAFRGLYTSAGAEANYGGIFAGKSNANSGNANGYLSLSYSASGTLTEGIRISETGKVGIGDSTPTANGLTVFSSVTGATRLNLHIGGSGTVPNSGSFNTISNNHHADILISSNGYINGNGNPVITSNHANMGGTGIKIAGANGSHDIKFYTSNASNFVRGTELINAERMTISNVGNVGIGTSAPSTKLDISTSGADGITLNADTVTATAYDWASEGYLRFPADAPIYLGAMSPKMTRMIGEIADGGLPLLYPPENFADVLKIVQDGAHNAGRSMDDIDLPACSGFQSEQIWILLDAPWPKKLPTTAAHLHQLWWQKLELTRLNSRT